jgi:hypothetical protein
VRLSFVDGSVKGAAALAFFADQPEGKTALATASSTPLDVLAPLACMMYLQFSFRATAGA